MASMQFTSFIISKANIPPPVPSVSFPQRASRVCFTTPTKQYSQRTHASKGNADEAVSYATGKSLSEMGGDAEDKLKEGQKAAGEIKDGSLDSLKESNERMKENVAEMKDKVSNMAGKSADKAGEETNKAVEMATDAKDKAVDAAGAAAEKAKAAATGAWDAAKEALAKED